MNLSEKNIERLFIAALLHDIGKLMIPNKILEKPDKLTDAEFALMCQHTYFTYSVINTIGGLEQIAAWAAFHHERLDGTGYPFHLTGRNINIGSRIIAVSDVFVALREDRPYREGMQKEQVGRIFKQLHDKNRLDGRIIQILMDHYDEISAEVTARQKAANRLYQINVTIHDMNRKIFIKDPHKGSLRIPLLDEQHQGMFGAINSFHYFLTNDYATDDCRKALALMVDYTKLHAWTEELLLQQSGFPGHEEQVAQHREMLEITEGFVQDPDIQQHKQQVLVFLKNTWLDHMKRQDRKYVKHLKRHQTPLGLDSRLFIRWRPDHNCGINLLDGQHRGIVSCINTMQYLIQFNREQKFTETLFQLMLDYGDVDFKTEENILQATEKYPHYDDHVQQHAVVRRQIKDLWRENPSHGEAQRVLDFLKRWWIEHIQEEVADFKKYGVGIEKQPSSAPKALDGHA